MLSVGDSYVEIVTDTVGVSLVWNIIYISTTDDKVDILLNIWDGEYGAYRSDSRARGMEGSMTNSTATRRLGLCFAIRCGSWTSRFEALMV